MLNYGACSMFAACILHQCDARSSKWEHVGRHRGSQGIRKIVLFINNKRICCSQGKKSLHKKGASVAVLKLEEV